MEINCLADDIIKKLQYLFALNKGATREILSYVLIDATGADVLLTATDGQLMQGSAQIGAKVVQPGKALLPGEILGFLKALKSSKAPLILKLSGDTLNVAVGKSSANFSIPSLTQYPQPLPYSKLVDTVETQQFLLATKLLGALSGKDPYDKVFMRADGQKLTMGTTDNFRLAFFDVPCTLSLPEVAVHASVLGPLAALGEEKQIRIGFSAQTLGLACSDYQFLVTTINAALPTNILKFYDSPDAKAFDPKALQTKVKAANAIADVLTLDLSGTISAESSRSNYVDNFDGCGIGTFIVNISHLLGALSMPMDTPLMGTKNIGPRALLAIKDQNMQQYLIPLEKK